MSYSSALNKINSVKNEVNDGANTAIRVGEAMRESLLFTKEETDKKPDTIDIARYKEDGSVLPLGAHYTYYGNPTQTLAGYCQETDNDFIAVCIYHWDDLSTIVLYVKDALDRYIYTSTFRSNEATNVLEQKVADLFGGMPVTYEQDGLMRATDKVVFDEMVTEVFPLTVAIASSNAGTYEVGSASVGAITPNIQLSITRRGADVAASANVTTSSGSVSQDKKTITDESVHSGTKMITVTVVQGGQTQPISATWKFMNYLYGGEVSTKPADASAVKTLIETTWASDTSKRSLSTATTKGSTPLAANKYYVFACRGSVNLFVRHAETNGVISGCTTGTVRLNRVNRSGTDDYTYVIVEKSSSSWNFKITN